MARHQRRIGQMADPDREIDTILDEVDHAVGQTEVGADVGIALQVGGHDSANMQPAEPDRRRDDELSLRPRALALDGVLSLLDIGQNPPRPLQVTGACVGQRHLPRGPLQQPRAKAVLQRRNQPRDARRRQAKLARRGGKAPQVGHRDEGLHGIDPVHPTIAYLAIV
jgi:hypothetical protein